MLTGEKKKLYQRDYMRSYMKARRLNVKTPDLLLRPVKTPVESVRPSNQELQAMINHMETQLPAPMAPTIPRYQWGVSKAGDKVRMPDGSIVTVPELDSEGHPIGW